VTGAVLAYDEHKGYGTVRGEDGRELFFHCTAIADGSRRIEVGALVHYDVVPGHRGRYQAVRLTPRSHPAPPAP